MKTLWSILSVIALANLLALTGIVGYLKMTDRLDGQRVRELRQLFAETGSQRKAREEEAKSKAEQDAAAAKESAKKGTAPVTAGDALDIKVQQSQVDLTRMEALKRDVQVLQETLARGKQALSEERAALNKEKKNFELARNIVRKNKNDAQFKKSLATIEGLKADKAKTALQTLIDLKQVDQVVSYLNAMQERTRTKVIDEFIKADPKVATDLLERLRTRGYSAVGTGGSP